MRVLEIRPARVEARHVEIGDMLVSSPIGDGAPKEPRWIGRVSDFITVEDYDRPEVAWRIERPDGSHIESAPVPIQGFVWVHLPSAPAPIESWPADLMGTDAS